jgi:hypothetical protein
MFHNIDALRVSNIAARLNNTEYVQDHVYQHQQDRGKPYKVVCYCKEFYG